MDLEDALYCMGWKNTVRPETATIAGGTVARSAWSFGSLDNAPTEWVMNRAPKMRIDGVPTRWLRMSPMKAVMSQAMAVRNRRRRTLKKCSFHESTADESSGTRRDTNT